MSIESRGDADRVRIIFSITSGTSGSKQNAEQTLPINGCVVGPMVFNKVFTAEECQSILHYASRFELRRGHTADVRPYYRRSKIAWLEPADEIISLYEKLAQAFRDANGWYKYKLVGFVEPLQFTVYDTGDSFDWHFDTGSDAGSTRKLSLTLQLTDGDTYKGGNLEFCGIDPLRFSRDLGTVVVFPSFLPHRVTRVTRGARYALVVWGHGPEFR